jgi:aldehyde dehydrogenase (NAD+)
MSKCVTPSASDTSLVLQVASVPNAYAAIAEINSRPEPLALYLFAEDKHVQNLVVQNTR